MNKPENLRFILSKNPSLSGMHINFTVIGAAIAISWEQPKAGK